MYARGLRLHKLFSYFLILSLVLPGQDNEVHLAGIVEGVASVAKTIL